MKADVISPGAVAVVLERARQVEDEDWSAEHDDGHVEGELLRAALAYLLHVLHTSTEGGVAEANSGSPLPAPEDVFPALWHESWWRPDARSLTKAGALIVAEWDRRRRVMSDDLAPLPLRAVAASTDDEDDERLHLPEEVAAEMLRRAIEGRCASALIDTFASGGAVSLVPGGGLLSIPGEAVAAAVRGEVGAIVEMLKDFAE